LLPQRPMSGIGLPPKAAIVQELLKTIRDLKRRV
jgi:hypothetical protein